MKMFLALTVALIPVIAVAQETCDNGRLFSSCGTACPLTCENYLNPPTFCTFQCVIGCFCPTGMVERGNECVNPSDCTAPPPPPTPPPTSPPTDTCTSGMVYETCGTACPLTCENHLSPPILCTLQCVQGCFCPSGLVENDGTCVAPSDCPTAPPTPPSTPPPTTLPTPCSNGMVFQTCGTACPLTCENHLNPPTLCSSLCVEGCFCPSGMVEYNGGCVAPSDCPTPTIPPTPPSTPPPTTLPTPCSNGMVFQTCGTACPLTCENHLSPPTFCSLLCVEGCFCPSGMVEYNGGCIAPSDCPAPPTTPPTPTCTNGMVYETCGTACPLTCENRNEPPRPCPTICVVGCFCPSGMAEYNGGCVAPTDCPPSPPTTPPTPTCTNGMVYNTCGTACPLTCENRNEPPRPCPEICAVGCFCPSGMVEYNGGCVAPTDCPPPPPTTPPTPTCTNGMVYETCGTACPLTCENRNEPPRPCPEICAVGCFCPSGMVEYNGGCVAPTDCPSTTTVPPPACTNGRIFNSCGTACPLTCEYPLPRPCVRICSVGCFCPEGLLENGDTCVTQDQCPSTTTTAATVIPTVATPESCPAGKEYRECGPVCRPTCLGFNGCFSLRCVQGCFCPEGQLEHEGGCVSECPDNNTPPPTRIPEPCDLIDCEPDTYCVVDEATRRGRCVPNARDTCQRNNGGCRDDQVCEMVNGYRQCRNPPYVLCGQDAFLACDSEWTYCLQQNKTRRAECVSSCFSRNGNCDSDSTCITTAPNDGDTPRLQCLKPDDLPEECPAGQVMNECGNHCQETCEQRLSGQEIACITVCGPPACTCPPGLVLFRDRCVDPRLCYTLTQYPPMIQPLPLVDPNSVILSLHSDSLDRHPFRDGDGRHRQMLLQSIEEVLSNGGLDDVVAQLHGIYSDDQGMQIVIMLTGSGIDSSSAEALASILNQHSQLLAINIEVVEPVEVEYVQQEQQSEGLSQTAIIAIAVSSGVAGLAVIVAWVAVVTCCCVMRDKNSRASTPSAYQASEKLENLYSLEERVIIVDPEKGKLVMESLSN